MNTTAPEVIFSFAGFTPGEGINALVAEKSVKIFRHEAARVSAVRIHAVHESASSGTTEFVVRVTCLTPGREHTVHARSVRPSTAMNLGFAKLERALASAFRERKHKEHRPRAIELPSILPKV